MRGAVIAAAHDDRVKSLVYIAALAPDEGETVADVFYRTAPHPKAPHIAPDKYGLIWMSEEGFGSAVAHLASPESSCHYGCGATANRGAMYSGKGPRASLEEDPLVVLGRARGSHD